MSVGLLLKGLNVQDFTIKMSLLTNVKTLMLLNTSVVSCRFEFNLRKMKFIKIYI